MDQSCLPFGRTNVSVDEVRTLIDSEQAASLLENQGVPGADERVRVFVNSVPGLLEWLAQQGRDFPWRHTTDPWRVYISEILLQRTRGDAVEAIYDEFFARYSDPASLDSASADEIQAVVSSLGFGNQRTRTLQEVAELCTREYNGSVPQDLEELQRPWRVGPYSARACLLFAFGEPVALVDANVARVVGRVFDYEMPTQPHKSDIVYELMEALVPADGQLARAFTLAILDLGAMVCTPGTPACKQCPLNDCCAFFQSRNAIQ